MIGVSQAATPRTGPWVGAGGVDNARTVSGPVRTDSEVDTGLDARPGRVECCSLPDPRPERVSSPFCQPPRAEDRRPRSFGKAEDRIPPRT